MKPQITIKDLLSFDRAGTVLALLLAGVASALMIQFVLVGDNPRGVLGPSFVLFWFGLMIFCASALWVDSLRRRYRIENKIEEVEGRVRASPRQAGPAWELARTKLESYLDWNLAQVGWMFVLTAFVSTAGFGLLAFGIWKSFSAPQSIAPAVIAAVSGILVQFIGATYLAIHRSTTAQAREYVDVLERINAVGMSIQVLEAIEGDDPADRNAARVQLTRELLEMYSIARKPTGRTVRKSR